MASPLTRTQRIFGSRLAEQTGLATPTVGAWLLSEMSSGAARAREQSGIHNWLNIGYTDSGQRGTSNPIWRDPVRAADATARWLRGEWAVPGFGRAAPGVQAILSARGRGVDAQLHALQTSGWASSGYPEIHTLVRQFGGRFGLQPAALTPSGHGGRASGPPAAPGAPTAPSDMGSALATLLAAQSRDTGPPQIPSTGVALPDGLAPQGYRPIVSSGGPAPRPQIDTSPLVSALTRPVTVESGVPGGGRARRGGQHVPAATAEPVQAALSWAANRLGVAEVAGSNRGPRIDDWQRSFGMLAQPWCGIFVGKALQQAGVQGIDGRIASTAAIVDMARSGEGGFVGLVSARNARPGDVWVTSPGPSGHTGIVEKVLRGGRIVVLEGNSSNSVRRVTRARGGYFARPNYPPVL